MQIRLSHVLILLLLTLLAGILSVQLLGAERGPLRSEGLVLLDLPGAPAGALQRAAGGFSHARMGSVESPQGPLQPFGALVAERLAAGNATLISLAPRGQEDPAGGVRLPGSRVVRDEGEALRALAEAVRGSEGAFLAAAALGGLALADLAALLDPLTAAVNALPPDRRVSIVLLGPRLAARPGSRRTVLRIDRRAGRGSGEALLADLLPDDG